MIVWLGRVLAVLALVLVAGACAMNPPGGGAGSNRDVLLREEIEVARASNALDLIQSQRPQWLRRRGVSSINRPEGIVVYLDAMRLGGVEVLRNLGVNDIESARFLGSSEATLRFGTDHTHGAILLTSR